MNRAAASYAMRGRARQVMLALAAMIPALVERANRSIDVWNVFDLLESRFLAWLASNRWWGRDAMRRRSTGPVVPYIIQVTGYEETNERAPDLVKVDEESRGPDCKEA